MTANVKPIEPGSDKARAACEALGVPDAERVAVALRALAHARFHLTSRPDHPMTPKMALSFLDRAAAALRVEGGPPAPAPMMDHEKALLDLLERVKAIEAKLDEEAE